MAVRQRGGAGAQTMVMYADAGAAAAAGAGAAARGHFDGLGSGRRVGGSSSPQVQRFLEDLELLQENAAKGLVLSSGRTRRRRGVKRLREENADEACAAELEYIAAHVYTAVGGDPPKRQLTIKEVKTFLFDIATALVLLRQHRKTIRQEYRPRVNASLTAIAKAVHPAQAALLAKKLIHLFRDRQTREKMAEDLESFMGAQLFEAYAKRIKSSASTRPSERDRREARGFSSEARSYNDSGVHNISITHRSTASLSRLSSAKSSAAFDFGEEETASPSTRRSSRASAAAAAVSARSARPHRQRQRPKRYGESERLILHLQDEVAKYKKAAKQRRRKMRLDILFDAHRMAHAQKSHQTLERLTDIFQVLFPSKDRASLREFAKLMGKAANADEVLKILNHVLSHADAKALVKMMNRSPSSKPGSTRSWSTASSSK